MFILIFIGLLISPISFAEHENKPLLQDLWLPNLEVNQFVRLVCNLLKGENVKLEWYFNDKIIEETNRKKIKQSEDSIDLIIKKLLVEDIGEYKCIASNQNGQDVKKVSMYFNVKPMFTNEPKDVTSSLFEEVVLNCETNGYPVPVVKWSKLSDSIHKKTIVKEFKASNQIKFGLSKENSGFYSCKATNLIGSIEKTIKVGYYGK